MPRRFIGLLAALCALGVLATPGQAQRKVRVVATLPDLKALTEAAGGDLVEVESLARGDQNAHDIEVRPSLMLRLRRADLLVRNGLGLDFWAEPLILGAHNPAILPGAAGHVDASRGIPVLAVPPGRVDRSLGDVHPEGNPHFTLDPHTAPIVTASIVEGLRRVAPQHAAVFEARRKDFLERLQEAGGRWHALAAAFRGTKVVTYHDNRLYFLQRFGLELVGTVEDKPGIPPSPGHLAALIRVMKERKVPLLIADPFSDPKVAELVAREAGAKLLVLPPAVGGAKGVTTYLDLFDHQVRSIAQALR
jgi:ABC-type Zn uptake system ZnuABC Zn-binding protein ZnuA